MSEKEIQLVDYIRDIPDFPIEGILFRDITPLLGDKDALDAAIKALAQPYIGKGIEYVAAVEARGFIFGSAVADVLGAGFIPIRKPGKLPYETESVTYDLEYGTDTLQVHTDAIPKGAKVIMVDDLLATGGTMAAACELMEKIGADIAGLSFLIELTALKGKDKLGDYPIFTTISY
jgi:adenine phosphoribosyltransferase